ncbi:MAG: hypothetical protein ACRDH2_13535, partial [Anaerolineales bacterium]
MSVWPFTTAELTAGLRRYFAEPTLHVRQLHERPLAPQAAGTLSAVSKHVRGLRVGYTVAAKSFSVECVVKDAQEATLAGLTGVGLREAGVYRSLAFQLPMETPALVAADPAGDWLVLEAVEAGIAPANWSAGDYRRAVRALAELHERFWDLADDLAAYPWLARSLTGEFEIHVYAAARATAKIIRDDQPRLITGSADALAALGQIV